MSRTKSQVDEKEEEEEKEPEVPPAGIMRIYKENKPEWHYMVFGSFFSCIVGAFPVLLAVFLAEIMGVSELCINYSN